MFKHLDTRTTLKHLSGAFNRVCSARSHSEIQHSGDLDVYDLCAADGEKGESLSAEEKYGKAKGMFYHNIRPVEAADTVCICVQNLLKREHGQKEGR